MVQIGQIQSAESYFISIESRGIWIPKPQEETKDTISQIKFSTDPLTLTVAIVSGQQLGIQREPDSCYHLKDVIRKASEKYGLMPCPAEVALQLRLDWSNQRVGETVEVVIDHNDYVYQLSIWSCGTYAGREVIFVREAGGYCYDKDDLFAFILPPGM